MPTLVCVPIMVESIDAALKDAALAKLKGADLVELRIDSYFQGSTGSDAEDQVAINELRRLLADCPLPVVLTCRSSEEGGDYDGDEVDRVSMLEKLTAACDTPPAYLDFELAAYQKSANIKQKINLCVAHPKQQRSVTTRLILSTHDFEGRPSDLERRLLAAYDEPACAVVKFAFRARSLRDNLDIFEITAGAPKPTIGLGMGEFGLMSRVLAPKFGGFLTFASLNNEGATAPGQPTLDELQNLYRFRAINPKTLVYGIIGWPVTQSMSPLIHNAGFADVGHDGVYLPMPITADDNDPDGSDVSFKATFEALSGVVPLRFAGASVTIPHKARLVGWAMAKSPSMEPEDRGRLDWIDPVAVRLGAANTVSVDPEVAPGGLPDGGDQLVSYGFQIVNTDLLAIESLLRQTVGSSSMRVAIFGTGGVARAAVGALPNGCECEVFSRSASKAQGFVESLRFAEGWADRMRLSAGDPTLLRRHPFDLYLNSTPLGMAGGPDPDALAIPLDELPPLPPETVIFDTVYNPIETPLIRAARERGLTVIDGVQMFVKQAAHQFELWTGKPAPEQLFDRLVREHLGGHS